MNAETHMSLELLKECLIPSEKTRTVAVYGKGGIGKSTTTSNLAAAASMLGLSTMLVGCDPKADTIQVLLKGEGQRSKTILESVRKNGLCEAAVRACIYSGFNDILLAEAGGPLPGVGCAGKGVALALDLLKTHDLVDDSLQLVLYDVLGDVVCGGFAQPMRANFANEVYVITSGEYMSMYQAVNIASSIAQMAKEGIEVKMSGLILNKRDVLGEDEIVEYLAELIGVPILMTIPRSTDVQRTESIGKTVVEALPGSSLARVYYHLAIKMYNNTHHVVPTVEDRDAVLAKLKLMIARYNSGSATPAAPPEATTAAPLWNAV